MDNNINYIENRESTKKLYNTIIVIKMILLLTFL